MIVDCRLLIGLTLVIALAGCDDRKAEAPLAAQRVEIGGGIVRGRVRFTGNAPAPRSTPAQPCHEGHSVTITDESLIVDPAGGVKNVFVCIVGVTAGDGSKREPAVLDQKDCRFVPHAVAVQVGQTLVIRSSDATMHNVHFQPQRNEAKNLSMTAVGQEQRVTFKSPEIFHVRCDVHPWMGANIGVFENPFFAITSEDGSFELGGLPEGKYQLSTWHERLGELTQEVMIAKEPVEATLTYKAE